MAMIDYGAIAWKNGKLISTDMFTDMKEMVGWSDEGQHDLEGNWFAYIGDEDLTLAFYKTSMRIYTPKYHDTHVFFGSENFVGWRKWVEHLFINNREMVEIKVKHRKFNDYYICKMTYNNNKYKVAFGYGVDLDCYKKYHVIDYYGTPWFRFKSLRRNFKYWLQDIKWRYRR